MAGLPPSTRRRGIGRGAAIGGIDDDGSNSISNDIIMSTSAASGSSTSTATSARQRWQGNNNNNHRRRPTISILVMILQLIAIFAISILVAIAIDLSGSGSSFSEGGSSVLVLVPPAMSNDTASASTASTSNRKPSASSSSDIELLENELRSLSAEYRELSNEIAQHEQNDRGGGGSTRQSVNSHENGLAPEIIIFDDGVEDVSAKKGVLIASDEDTKRDEVVTAALQKEEIREETKEGGKKKARRKKNKKVIPKKYWIRTNLSFTEESTNNNNDLNDLDPLTSITGGGGGGGAIIPIDLSVNHLQRIIRVPGAPNNNDNNNTHDGSSSITNNSIPVVIGEEFLPVVQLHEIDFRWRSQARQYSRPEHAVRTSAYRIVARRAQYSNSLDGNNFSTEDENEEEVEGSLSSSTLVWDSGKVSVPDGLPDVVHCSDTQLANKAMIGSIIQWRVTVWDSRQSPQQPRSSTSGWTKFAIGPTQEHDINNYDIDGNGDETNATGDNDDDDDDDDLNGWKARWISHPIDIESWDKTDGKAFWANIPEDRETACRNWEKRSQLPLFRAKVKLPSSSSSNLVVENNGANKEEDQDRISSALLVVSGLGSFRASFDGVPLSSSGPLDPPFTDFSQRVSYRGFDVTRFLTRNEDDNGIGEGEHIVGISMGSGE